MELDKNDYMNVVNCFNAVSGFTIHFRNDLDDSYADLLPYAPIIASSIKKAEHYEKIRKQGYYDDILEKELGRMVLEINQVTLCVV